MLPVKKKQIRSKILDSSESELCLVFLVSGKPQRLQPFFFFIWASGSSTHTPFSVSSHTAARTDLFKPPASASSGFADIFWDYSIEFRVIEEQGDGERVISFCLVESGIVNAQHTQRWEIQHHLHSKDLICHTAKNKVLHWIDVLTGDKHLCVSVSSVSQQVEMT